MQSLDLLTALRSLAEVTAGGTCTDGWGGWGTMGGMVLPALTGIVLPLERPRVASTILLDTGGGGGLG